MSNKEEEVVYDVATKGGTVVYDLAAQGNDHDMYGVARSSNSMVGKPADGSASEIVTKNSSSLCDNADANGYSITSKMQDINKFLGKAVTNEQELKMVFLKRFQSEYNQLNKDENVDNRGTKMEALNERFCKVLKEVVTSNPKTFEVSSKEGATSLELEIEKFEDNTSTPPNP